MIAVDTNVLLRYLYPGNDPPQGRSAADLIEGARERGEAVYVSTIVLCELLWTLRTALKLGRPDLSAVLQQILAHVGDGAFAIQDEALVRLAVQDYAAGHADFADYLIGRSGQAAGASTTYTFDRTAAAASTFKLLRRR